MIYSFVLRRIVHHLRGRKFFYENTFSSHRLNYQRTVLTVQLFYIVSVFFGVSEMSWGWPDLMRSQFIEVLWPFELLKPWIRPVLIPLGFYGWIVGALLSSFFPSFFWGRLLHGISVFIIIGLRNSDGHFGHSFHAYMWISLLFVFLPNIKSNKLNRRLEHKFIQYFWAAQFIICVFYFMTGLWKVRSLVECALSSELQCEMSVKVLTNIAAQELVQYRKFAPIAWVLFAFPWIGFVSYVATIWIHLYSIHFAFRPNLHGIFGLIRIVFHLGTLVLFGVNFSPFTLSVVSIFLFSPFISDDQDLINLIKTFPPFDGWHRCIRDQWIPKLGRHLVQPPK